MASGSTQDGSPSSSSAEPSTDRSVRRRRGGSFDGGAGSASTSSATGQRGTGSSLSELNPATICRNSSSSLGSGSPPTGGSSGLVATVGNSGGGRTRAAAE